MTVLVIILIIGLAVFTVYEGVQLFKAIRLRIAKKKKKDQTSEDSAEHEEEKGKD